MPGTTASEAEVANDSKHCLWMLIGGEELSLAYIHFPWFKVATI